MSWLGPSVLQGVQVLILYWLSSRVVKSVWFHQAVLVCVPPLVACAVQYHQTGRLPEPLGLAHFALMGASAAVVFRRTRQLFGVPMCVFWVTLGCHVEDLCCDAAKDVLCVLSLWCLREFQQQSVAAAAGLLPATAVGVWRAYENSELRDRNRVALAHIGLPEEQWRDWGRAVVVASRPYNMSLVRHHLRGTWDSV